MWHRRSGGALLVAVGLVLAWTYLWLATTHGHGDPLDTSFFRYINVNDLGKAPLGTQLLAVSSLVCVASGIRMTTGG